MAVIDAEEAMDELPRTLGLFDLMCIGIGATIGSGIFSTAGSIISSTAGPAAVLSWIFSGIVACLNALAYMELTTRIPSSGSTYAYAYHAIGELPAVIAAWMLTLEYAVSGVGTGRSWAQKVEDWLDLDYPNGNFHWLNLEYANILSTIVQGFSVIVLLIGVRFGKNFVNTFTCFKVCIVFIIIIAGFAAFNADNMSPFIPDRQVVDGVAAFGIQGVMTGASQSFFGYVGFDEICCLSAETKNPKKIIPIAILIVVIGTMVLSAVCSFVLSGMVPYTEASSFAAGFDGRGWTAVGSIVRAGEVISMPVVVLIGFLAQPRLQYALACDGLMPAIFKQVNDKGNLYWNILISGIFFTIVALIVPFVTLWDIVTFGVMMSFNLANCSLLMIRIRDESPKAALPLTGALFVTTGFASFLYQSGYANHGSDVCGIFAIIFFLIAAGMSVYIHVKCPQAKNDPRFFSAPLVPYIQTLCMLGNWYMVSQLANLSLALSVAWVAAGVLSYFVYGYKHAVSQSGWTELLNGDHTTGSRVLAAPVLSARRSSPMSASLNKTMTPTGVYKAYV